VKHFEHKYDYVTNEGRTFFFRTNRDGAAKYKVVKITLPPAGDALETDAAALAALPFEVRCRCCWVCVDKRTRRLITPSTTQQEVVPASEGVLMDAQAVAGSYLLLHYLKDVVDELEVCPLFENGGSARVKVPLPGKGT
jgi:hypothetical protein